MIVLGIQGSPRAKGNASTLLSEFLNESERLGGRTYRLDVPRMNISPCKACGFCEKKGFCAINDDMYQVYPLIRQADIIVLSTPIYFYGPTAQLKALIDRAQALWARRYVQKLMDPGAKSRRGLLVAIGATKGKNLFNCVKLTA